LISDLSASVRQVLRTTRSGRFPDRGGPRNHALVVETLLSSRSRFNGAHLDGGPCRRPAGAGLSSDAAGGLGRSALPSRRIMCGHRRAVRPRSKSPSRPFRSNPSSQWSRVSYPAVQSARHPNRSVHRQSRRNTNLRSRSTSSGSRVLRHHRTPRRNSPVSRPKEACVTRLFERA
jgi:hypothetical protein